MGHQFSPLVIGIRSREIEWWHQWMSSHGPLCAILLYAGTFTTFTCVEFEVVVIYFFIILLARSLDLEVELLGYAHGIFT